MKIEIGYITGKYSSRQPDYNEIFPFKLKGNVEHAISLQCNLVDVEESRWMNEWLQRLNAFPVYLCIKTYQDWIDDFQETCEAAQISFTLTRIPKGRTMAVATLTSATQLQALWETAVSLGTMNDFAAWSLHEKAFTWHNGKLNVHVEQPESTVFWIDYDGQGIVVLSNDTRFSTYDKLIATLPSNIMTERFEYAEEGEERTKKIVIDVSAAQTPVDLHTLFQKKLSFPPGYAPDWQGFWDALTSLEADIPETLVLKRWNSLAASLPSEAEKLKQTLQDFQRYYGKIDGLQCNIFFRDEKG
ncbi:barstar family protein [Fictibacillus iocasae]|uniref:Barstar family protein n=1 Tax=Fictibacillus iocasae TaxID=2715437 RepID=A0ABW2NP17_9BACL